MADDLDLAAEIEDLHRRASLSVVLAPPPRTRSTGVCNWCGDRIEAERLKAVPDTPHCSECAAELAQVQERARRVGR